MINHQALKSVKSGLEYRGLADVKQQTISGFALRDKSWNDYVAKMQVVVHNLQESVTLLDKRLKRVEWTAPYGVCYLDTAKEELLEDQLADEPSTRFTPEEKQILENHKVWEDASDIYKPLAANIIPAFEQDHYWPPTAPPDRTGHCYNQSTFTTAKLRKPAPPVTRE